MNTLFLENDNLQQIRPICNIRISNIKPYFISENTIIATELLEILISRKTMDKNPNCLFI